MPRMHPVLREVRVGGVGDLRVTRAYPLSFERSPVKSGSQLFVNLEPNLKVATTL